MANTRKLFEKAEKLLQKQKFDSALEVFVRLFEVQPHNETVLLNLADLSLRLDRTDDSLRYNRLLADLYTERNVVSKAVVTCRKILTAAPQDVPTLARIAFLFKKTRKTAGAIGAFREAAELYLRNGETDEALECLKQVVDLDPGNIGAHVKLAELAGRSGKKSLGSETLLKAAAIARKNKMEDRWAELADLAYQLDPASAEGRIAAAEVCFARNRARDAVALLEPMVQAKQDEAMVLKLLCRAYLGSHDYEKAEAICIKLYQSHPETIDLMDKLIRSLLKDGETGRALSLVERIREQMCLRQEDRAGFLALVEQIYHADETNLDVLELLPPLYNELNREVDLWLALTRLFNLYIAGEQYEKAAETLEGILDVDPYGAGHSDRLLNLEGHIDAIWYDNIASRISLPGAGQGLGLESAVAGGEPVNGATLALDDLIVEAEVYQRYHLKERLEETVRKINRLYPEAHENNEALRGLYELANFQPAPVQHPPSGKAAGDEDATASSSLKDLSRISTITSIIHRQGTPEGILKAAVEQLGRLIAADRCWIAIGSLDAGAPLTAEYISPEGSPFDQDAALKIWFFLMQHSADPEGWSFNDVSGEKHLESVAAEMQLLGTRSLLGIPLTEKEELAGLLLVEQCRETRRWTDGEKMLLKTVASQVMIAIHNTKLRRLVRSLAGTDPLTGLLPRSAYLDCLLAEASRAEEQSRPLSVCLMEPVGAAALSEKLGAARIQAYFKNMGLVVSSHVRQNDIAIRYGPCTVAICLPDTLLAQSRMVVEKLQEYMRRTKPIADVSFDFSATVGELFLGPGFDAVDAVTEIINRLEASLETLRNQPRAGLLVSRYED